MWGRRWISKKVVIQSLIYQKPEQDPQSYPSLPREFDCEDDMTIYLEINN